MINYQPDELDITQWQPKGDDNKFLVNFQKIGNDLWKGDLYKTYGLNYKAFVSGEKIREILNLGWILQEK